VKNCLPIGIITANMNLVPLTLKKFFWDVELDTIDTQKHSSYVIDRLLKIGDISSWRWLIKNYSSNQIKLRILRSKQLTKKDISFFSLIFDLPKKYPKYTK